MTSHILSKAAITSFHMNNRKWVTLHISWKTVSSHLFLWPIDSQWNCTFCKMAVSSHCEQQEVSDIAHFVKDSLITYFPMTNSKWVILHILWRQPHHSFSFDRKWVTLHILWKQVSSYDQQRVRNIRHSVTGSLITSFSMTNSRWVTLHILWNAV